MIKYKLFPKIEEVFVNITNHHKVVFFPLISIDLESIGKGKGIVHFVSYFRNGEETENVDTNFAYNFIKFKVVDNQYQFDGDFNKIYLFEKSTIWYKEAVQIYKEHKSEYMTNSELVKIEDNRRMEIDFEYYYYIKGVLNYWVTRDKYIETGKFIQGSAYTYGNSNHERDIYKNIKEYDDYEEYDGKKNIDEILEETLTEIGLKFENLKFIGSIAGYNYLEFGADEITLFLNGKGEVFQYYNWS